MPLKLYIIKLQTPSSGLAQKRTVEHLFVKYSGVKITLSEAINIITSVSVGNEVEVLFNSDKLAEIEKAFLKHSIVVIPKAKEG